MGLSLRMHKLCVVYDLRATAFMLPMLTIQPMVENAVKHGICKCFGNFEVFTPAGEALHFSRTKAKEAFAYLVYKRGASCTSREVAAVLFEDAPYDEKQQVYFQQIVHSMMKALRQAHAEGAITKRYKAMAVNPEVIDCDFYCYMKHGPMEEPFIGEFMAQYAWAEGIIGDLNRV